MATKVKRWTEGIVEEQPREYPYYFGSSSFKTRFRSPEGQITVLPKFTDKSPVFRGIENYWFAVMETQPSAFVIPHYSDADVVFVVVKGKGTVAFVSPDARESFIVEYGDVVVVPAGTTVYMTNLGENEPFQVAKLYQAGSNPGTFKEFFVAGAEMHQQAYYYGFGGVVNMATLNSTANELWGLFGGAQVGRIRKASPAQVKALGQQATYPEKRHNGSKWAPFNLCVQSPTYSNEYGKLFDACPDVFNQLNDMNVSVSLINMTAGSVMTSHFNSRAWTIVFVIGGKGRFEMGEQREADDEEGRSGEIHKIRAEMSQGDVFVIPPCHPVALVADDELRAVGFGINARKNQRNFISGQNSIVKELEKEAKEVTFGVEVELVDKVYLTNAVGSVFVPNLRDWNPEEVH